MQDLPPLLVDQPTGYSNRRCYAAASDDCSPKISREHWISANILDNISDGRFIVSGMRWGGGVNRELSTRALASNILCSRHNSALSALDLEVGRLFKVWQVYRHVMESRIKTRLFAIFTGSTIERWLVKFLLGAVASGTFRSELNPDSEPLANVEVPRLLQYLFRESGSQPLARLYQDVAAGIPVTGLADVEMAAAYNAEGGIRGCGVAFGPLRLNLALGAVPYPSAGHQIIERPGGVIIKSVLADAQTVFALAWDAPGSGMTTYTYAGERKARSGWQTGAFP